MGSMQTLYKNAKDMEVHAEKDQSFGQDDALYFPSLVSLCVCERTQRELEREWLFLFLTLCSSKQNTSEMLINVPAVP